ncbi:MAG: hypothetical protein ACOX25_03485 [Caldicoprobacterales bacterium]
MEKGRPLTFAPLSFCVHSIINNFRHLSCPRESRLSINLTKTQSIHFVDKQSELLVNWYRPTSISSSCYDIYINDIAAIKQEKEKRDQNFQ